jgi:mevalonate kinase
MSDTTNLEKKSLEAHVDLCALRYAQLEARLDKLEQKFDDFTGQLLQMRQDFFKIMIGSSATIIVAIIGAIATLYK